MPIQTIKSNLEESPVLFSTFKIINSLPVFSSKEYFGIILDSLNWYRQNRGIKIYAYTILINHLHLVLEFSDDWEGEKVIAGFKKYTAKKIINRLKEDKRYDILEEMWREGFKINKEGSKVWEVNSWPVAITSDKFFNQKVAYTDYNASHHKVVKDIETWPYTSFHNHYCSHPCLLKIDAIYS